MMTVEEDNVKAFGNEFLAPVGLAVRWGKYIQKERDMQGMWERPLPTVQEGRSVAQ